MKLLGVLLALVGRLCLSKSLRHVEFAIFKAHSLRLRGKMREAIVAALVAGEDHRFYEHRGVDPIAIGRAFFRFLTGGRLSGASTIEQQLVRVLTGRRERTLSRKLREMVFAACISEKYSKSDIASMYLGVAYFGWGMNGVEEAAKRLSIDLSTTTCHQAASLVARLKYPQPCELTADRQALIARRTEHIFKRMSHAPNSLLREMPSDEAILDI